MYVRPVNFILPKSIPQKIEVVEFGTRKVDILFLECLSTDNSSPSTPGSLQANSNASNLSLNLISPLRYMDSIMEEIDLFLVIAGFNTTALGTNNSAFVEAPHAYPSRSRARSRSSHRMDCPDCEDSQFCHSSRVSHPQLQLGIRYPNLID
ncbi:hypothetical protein Tco_0548253 [Tanacetum coccineum]